MPGSRFPGHVDDLVYIGGHHGLLLSAKVLSGDTVAECFGALILLSRLLYYECITEGNMAYLD